jgi:hypothetical protein
MFKIYCIVKEQRSRLLLPELNNMDQCSTLNLALDSVTVEFSGV